MPKTDLVKMQEAAAPVGPLSNMVLLGRSGLRVSPLCLGAMAFGETWMHLMGDTSKESSRVVFNTYCDLGGRRLE